jgi:hypothetical protein
MHAALNRAQRLLTGHVRWPVLSLEQRTRARIRTTHNQICRFDKGCMK